MHHGELSRLRRGFANSASGEQAPRPSSCECEVDSATPSHIEWGSINMMHTVVSYQRDSKWGRLRALPAADKASKKEWQRSKFDERTRVTNFGYRNRT